MKKILLSVIAVLSLLVMVPVVKADSKVTVYMYTKDGCPACKNAEEYFTGLLKEEPKLFKTVNLEIFDKQWNSVSDDAYKLMTDTLAYFDESTDPKDIATPLIVIGNYHSIGLPSDKSLVYDAIIDAKKADKEVDVVKQIAKESKINYKDFIKSSKKFGVVEIIIIIAVVAILLGGIAGVVILNKKKN